MSNCRVGALTAALCLWSGLAQTEDVRLVSELTWSVEDPRFGGLSGLEVSADGQSFVAIGDRGLAIRGTLRRNNGIIVAISGVHISDLKTDPVEPGSARIYDAEGLAGSVDGPYFVAFEGVHRVDRYDRLDTDARPLVRPVIPEGFFENGGLEALAMDGRGRLFAIPENKRRRITDYPVLMFDGTWKIPFRITGVADMRPVGADFGPDGSLYLLERTFHGLFGFSSQVRRFDPGEKGVQMGQVLLQTSPGTHDNLEGIAVWRDRNGGLRLTMVSDNNFSVFQRTQFVEYRLTE